MKIISYNINGLNSFVTKNKIIELFNEHNADVYCFQEVRANDLKIKDLLAPYLNDYTYVTSLNNVKKGYAGVMTLMKNDVYKQTLGVEEKTFDQNLLRGAKAIADWTNFYKLLFIYSFYNRYRINPKTIIGAIKMNKIIFSQEQINTIIKMYNNN